MRVAYPAPTLVVASTGIQEGLAKRARGVSFSGVADGTIEVVATHPAAAFFYSAMKVNIEVDGNLSKQAWGNHAFRVAPGTHEVAVSYPWLFMSKCGRKKVQVEIGSGETVRVTYRARFLRYVPGKMKAEKVSSTRQ